MATLMEEIDQTKRGLKSTDERPRVMRDYHDRAPAHVYSVKQGKMGRPDGVSGSRLVVCGRPPRA